jgi:ubiquinone/menaquinone biosynthesis C-methylase UbiE
MDKDIIRSYYATGVEKQRLILDKLEGIRSKEIIQRYLPSTPIDIIDIGGATGYYAFWLQQMGHRVTLFDLTPENIEVAKEYAKQNGIQLANAMVGDATDMAIDDQQFDLALLFGPLYHLTEKQDRVRSLSETKRVLKPGGIMLAAIISRYASLFDGFRRNLVDDERFFSLLNDDLRNGVHINKTENIEYFTTAFFHTLEEIRNEVKEAGLHLTKLIAVESFAWVIDNFNQRLNDADYMKKLNQVINIVESNEDLVAMSPHIIVVAEKK